MLKFIFKTSHPQKFKICYICQTLCAWIFHFSPTVLKENWFTNLTTWKRKQNTVKKKVLLWLLSASLSLKILKLFQFAKVHVGKMQRFSGLTKSWKLMPLKFSSFNFLKKPANNAANEKKNNKFRNNFWKESYHMHYNFHSRKFSLPRQFFGI